MKSKYGHISGQVRLYSLLLKASRFRTDETWARSSESKDGQFGQSDRLIRKPEDTGRSSVQIAPGPHPGWLYVPRARTDFDLNSLTMFLSLSRNREDAAL